MRRLAAFLAIAWACCLANGPAQAGKRVALVIGNASYQSVPPLANPVNDAAAVAEMFKKAAFDVVMSRHDLKSLEMRRALREFTDRAHGADIAVIYFAGHGLEVDGTNYVVPVDAVLERDADVDDEAVSLNRILMAAEPATRLRLIILDACRDNPFARRMKRTLARRAVSRGLVSVEADRPNTFIAFAAKEGSTAADGNGEHSPFTLALLKHLTTPGLDIRKAFGFVRDDVMSATGDQQEPYTTNSLGGSDVALVPGPAAPPAAAGDPNAGMRKDYELAERVGTVEAWDYFITTHPAGFYTDLAKAQRNKLAAEGKRTAVAAGTDDQARAAGAAGLAVEDKKGAGETPPAATVPPKPAADAAPAAKPAQTAVAAATPSEAIPARPVPPDLPRLLQAELKRVGCKAGDVSGEWNASARRALSMFNDNAGTRFDVKAASIEALDAVSAKQGRVCPLDCERGYRPSGDKCVRVACDEGYVLGANGSCEKRPERERAHEHRATSRRGGKCFVYGGSSFCE